jgi:hypothetical protein
MTTTVRFDSPETSLRAVLSFHSPAAQSSSMPQRRLDHLVVAAGEVCFATLGSDGEREPLVPARLESIVAVGRPGIGDGRAGVVAAGGPGGPEGRREAPVATPRKPRREI